MKRCKCCGRVIPKVHLQRDYCVKCKVFLMKRDDVHRRRLRKVKIQLQKLENELKLSKGS